MKVRFDCCRRKRCWRNGIQYNIINKIIKINKITVDNNKKVIYCSIIPNVFFRENSKYINPFIQNNLKTSLFLTIDETLNELS